MLSTFSQLNTKSLSVNAPYNWMRIMQQQKKNNKKFFIQHEIVSPHMWYIYTTV